MLLSGKNGSTMLFYGGENMQKFKQNLKSGLTTSLVSIPLSVSLAVASKTTPTVGIITAVWAGLIASIFGGSNYNIIGPTGALSGLLAVFAMQYGMESLAMIAIVTGIIILLAFAFKIERFLVFVPASTIHGFTLGVAFIIALNQANYALGITGLESKEKFIENVYLTVEHIGSASITTFLVFMAFLATLMLLKKFAPKIPGAVLLSPVGLILGYLTTIQFLPISLFTLESKFGDISGSLFIAPKIYFNYELLSASLVVALIAILETMISAKVADGMTKTKHNKRKEIFGLGLANIGAGLFGGMPATAALARTSLNIKAGATDKTSATINSVIIAIISLLFIKYFKFMPLAVIAAILVNTAINMVEREHFERFFRTDKVSFIISLLVAFITIYEDPIVGILFGVAISLFVFMDKMSKGQFELVINDENKKISGRVVGDKIDGDEFNIKGETLVYSITGQLAYINGQAHISRFEQGINGYKNVVLRLRGVHFVDMDGVDTFDEILEIIKSKGGQVYITGVTRLIEDMLMESDDYRELKEKGHIFASTGDALKHLGFELDSVK